VQPATWGRKRKKGPSTNRMEGEVGDGHSAAGGVKSPREAGPEGRMGHRGPFIKINGQACIVSKNRANAKKSVVGLRSAGNSRFWPGGGGGEIADGPGRREAIAVGSLSDELQQAAADMEPKHTIGALAWGTGGGGMASAVSRRYRTRNNVEPASVLQS